MSTRTTEERLWARVRKSDGCWEWTGALLHGYGHMCVGGGRTERTHRVSWVLHNGPIPSGLLVCHHCDNRKCVRPDHLFLGTYSDNALDRERKGRGRPNIGEHNPRSKVNANDVAEIRRRVSEGTPAALVAREYGISATQACRIRDGESWGHLAGAA